MFAPVLVGWMMRLMARAIPGIRLVRLGAIGWWKPGAPLGVG